MTYDEDPAFFASLGWDETIYALADNLCYLDPAINAGTMNAVADYPYGEQGLGQRLAGALAYGEAYFRGSGVSQYMLVIPVALFAWLMGVGGLKKWSWPEGFMGCALAGGAFLLCFYLCYKGRFPVRTFMLVAIPTGVAELLMLLKAWGKRTEYSSILSKCGEGKGKSGRIFKNMGIFFTALAVAWGLGMSWDVLLGYDKSQLIENNAAVEAYAMAHPDNVYITDVTGVENINAFAVYPDKKPTNLVDWGGTGMHSGWKEAQLQANGLEDFTGRVFRREGVYFITMAEEGKLDALYRYLAVHEEATGYTVLEPIGEGLAVYRFTFKEDLDAGEEAG